MILTIDSAYRFGADTTVGVVLAVAIIGLSLRHQLDAPRQWLVAWLVADALASVAAAVATGALIVALTLRVEVFGDFSKFTGAIHGLTIAVAGSALVIQRATRARGDMLRDPIFLVGVAFLLIGTPSAFLALAVRQLRDRDRDWRLMVFTLKNAVTIVAYLLMVIAIRSTNGRVGLPLSRARR